MKKEIVVGFTKDERFSLVFSFQKTSSKNWHNYYISFLSWCLSVLVVDKFKKEAAHE